MARPRPGQRGYSGPVSEGWGRPVQNLVGWADKSARDAQRTVDQHIRNAAGIPGDVDRNVRDFLGRTFGFGQPSRPATRTGSNVGQGAGGSSRARIAAARGQAARQKAQAAQRSDKAKMSAARGSSSRPAPKPARSRATPVKTGSNSRTKAVGRAAAKVAARNPGLTASQARAKARGIVKKRG